MSFPNVIYGAYGDEKVTAASAIGGLPLGQKMILPDGREFCLAQEGATTGVTGKVYAQSAIVGDHGNIAGSGLAVAASAAIGATTVVLTCGGTTVIAASAYNGGYLNVMAGTVGFGHMYKIKSNNAATLGVTCTVILDPKDGLAEAVIASSTMCSLRVSPFKNLVLQAAGSTFVGAVAGVPPVAIPATHFGWVQRKGIASVFTAATAGVTGNPVCCSTTDAGALVGILSTSTVAFEHFVIGQCLATGDNSSYLLTMLSLP